MSRVITLLSIGCATAIGVTAYCMLTGGGPDIAVPKAGVTGAGQNAAVIPGTAAGARAGESGPGGSSARNPNPAGAGDAGAGAGTPTSGGSNTGNSSSRKPSGGDAANAENAATANLAESFDRAQRAHSAATITALVNELQARVAARPADREAWHVLARALLQRVIEHGSRRGMRPGRPVYTDLPASVTADLDAAQAALDRAANLGDDSAAHHRVQAEIMSQRITGLASALKWNGEILAAIGRAGERDSSDPQLHLVLGIRKLMAPRFLGQDVDGALEHFAYVAEQRPTDERPAVFAAMAHYLAKKRLQAIRWLERAVERNPSNVFARAVLQRVRRGEDDPFGRDVTGAEADAVAPK